MASTDATVRTTSEGKPDLSIPLQNIRTQSITNARDVVVENQNPMLWRVAYLQTHGLAALELVAIDQGASSTEIMETLQHRYRKRAVIRILNMIFLFRHQALFEGHVSRSDIEAQSGRVGVMNVRSNSLLTEAFRHPAILSASPRFISPSRYCVSKQGADGDNPIGALVIGWATRKECLVYFICTVIMFSMGIGVLVGFLSQSAALGLAVCGWLGTFISCVEVLLCWQFR